MHVVGTAGHVDHGKSALVERLTGIDPDRFAEEKRRGLTIDLGFAWFTLPSGNSIGIVDVPGHERFIANMLAGAGGISVCLFVVAANEGWKPQSAEHLAILDILGVTHGVVALTKSDTVSVDALAQVREEVRERLAGTSLEGMPIVACSALTGDGIEELVAELDRAVSASPPPSDIGRPRLWVDRVFTIAGAGTVVTGTLAGGSFSTGDEVELSPSGRVARIRKIQSHKEEVTTIGPGNRTALNLVGLERKGAARGDAVVEVGHWQPTHTVDALVRVLPASVLGTDHELSEKGSHLLYAGTAETPVRVKLRDGSALQAGHEGLAQLHLRDALPLARGDHFVLRDAGRVLTFGGGEILDPLPGPARRADERRLGLLRASIGASPQEMVTMLVEAEGRVPRSVALLRAGADRVPDDVISLGELLVSKDSFDAIAAALRSALEEHHRARPLEPGMPREAARAAVDLDPRSFDALLERLEDVEGRGATVTLVGHRVALAPQEEAERKRLLEILDEGGFSPPMTKELGADPALLRALTDAGDVVKVGDFYLSSARASEARTKVRAALEERGPLTVAEIRDLLVTTRKYAVPLCEWLDDTGATLRRGDLRHLGPNP